MHGLLLATLLAASTTAPAPNDVDASVPEQYRAAVADAQRLGDILFKEDVAAWTATDAMVAAGLADKHTGTASGWLAHTPDADGRRWTVSFTARDTQREFSFADVNVTLGQSKPQVHVQALPKGRVLDADERLLARARDQILKRSDWRRCAANYNYSLGFFAGDQGREVIVKLLPARSDNSVFPFGGFHEFRLSADKGTELSHFAQTRACLDLPTPPANAVGFAVSHLTSEAPTQFHVFLSLSYDKPVYVGTTGNKMAWKVEAGRISVVGDIKAKAEPATR